MCPAANFLDERYAMSTGEILYTVLLSGVLWWAYNTLKQYF